MLSARSLQVLDALVREYVVTIEPVGSKRLVENYNLNVSSATVRQELSMLEKSGHLVQPHTSAGRIPTDLGYRAVVDDYFQRIYANRPNLSKRFLWQLEQTDVDPVVLVTKLGTELSEHTSCLVIASEPSHVSTVVRRVSLTQIDSNHLVLVLVCDDGRVANRIIDFSQSEAAMISLETLEQRLNASLNGITREDILRSTTATGYLLDGTSGKVLREIIHLLQEIDGHRTHQLGMSSLLSQPEFQNAAKAAGVIDAVSTNENISEDVATATFERKLIVRIGGENRDEALHDLSILISPYYWGQARGAIALVGPTRMDYPKTIAALWAAIDAYTVG